MQVNAITTMTDWAWNMGCWGKVGVYRTMDVMKMADIKNLYWRTHDGGKAMYPSKVSRVSTGDVYDEWKTQNFVPKPTTVIEFFRFLDYNTYDPIPDAIEAAKNLGINLHLWYSIFEEEHGIGLSDFAKEHPEYWQMDREGRTYEGTVDFFFEEVRQYKLAIAKELLQYKGSKGMMLDFVRHNACPSSDVNGIHRFGYNPEIREHYKQLYGKDPVDLAADDEQWLTFKREYNTSLVSEIRKLMDEHETCKELSLMLWPEHYPTWACLDVPELTKDSVQMVTSMSIKYSIHPDAAVEEYDILKNQVANDKVKILPGIQGYNFIYPYQIGDLVQKAEEHGVEEMMFYEAPSLITHLLTSTFRAINTGVPEYKRQLTATKVDTEDPEEIDWSAIPEYSDFLFTAGDNPQQVPSEKTIAQIAYNDREIIFRFTCFEEDMETALAPTPEKPQHQYYLNVLGLRAGTFLQRSASVYLDPKNSHQSYYHFAVTPQGEQGQQTFVIDRWDGKWDSSVGTEKDKWIALMRIPYSTLDIAPPKKGDQWCVDLIRGNYSKKETVAWFYTIWDLPLPHDLGRLNFL